MVSVGRVGSPAVPNAGARRVAGNGGFAVATPGSAGSAAPATAATAASLDGMLLLQQQVEDGPTRDRRARKHGRAMLEGLSSLQHELLDGEVDPGTLERLAALTEHCPEAADPALKATLASVSLRVQVELARRSM